jgi:hypothetical protein
MASLPLFMASARSGAPNIIYYLPYRFSKNYPSLAALSKKNKGKKRAVRLKIVK